MPAVDIVNFEGQKVGSVDLPEQVFGIEPRPQVVSEYVKMYLANQRLGTANTKNRSAVAGGGSKPYRQKGTGRARQGTIRAPQFVGGGRVFGPTPRDFSYRIPKKKRRLALNSVLSDRAQNGKCLVVDEVKLANNKTKDIARFLKSLGLETKNYLMVMGEHDEIVLRCARNIPNVDVKEWKDLNAYDALKHELILIDKKVVDAFAKEGDE